MGILLNRAALVELTIIGAVLLYFATASSLPTLPVCPVKLVAGVECPTCGVTRSVWHLLHGRFSDAYALNPIGYLVLAVAIRRGVVLFSPERLRRMLEHCVVNVVLLSWFFVFGAAHVAEHLIARST